MRSDMSGFPRPSPDPDLPGHLLLQWHLTEECNLRCAHCYQEKQAGGVLSLAGMLHVLAEFRALLAALEERRGAPLRAHITVTGGEPFLHPEFLPLLGSLAEQRVRWTFAVLSNGTLVTEEHSRHLARLRPAFVQISIEGSESTHDRIRGRGAYARAVQGVGALVAAGVPVFLAFTARRDNLREFPAVAALGRRLGVRRVWADRMVPLGCGEMGQVLDPQESRLLFQDMAEARGQGRGTTEVALHRALQFLIGGGRAYRCTAGRSLLTILPGGEVCPCRRMPSVAGNLFASPLCDLYFGSPLLRRLRERREPSRGCEGCFYARTCGGGLRCLAAAMHGDPFVADPGCWLARGAEDAFRGTTRLGMLEEELDRWELAGLPGCEPRSSWFLR